MYLNTLQNVENNQTSSPTGSVELGGGVGCVRFDTYKQNMDEHAATADGKEDKGMAATPAHTLFSSSVLYLFSSHMSSAACITAPKGVSLRSAL